MIERLRQQPERLVHWAAIAAWVALPFVFGPGLSQALGTWDHNTWVVDVALFAVGWIVLLTALLLPAPITLSVVRIGGPATVPLAVWISTQADDTSLIVLALVSALVVSGLLLSSAFADRFIDGASYGEERRFALKPPGPVLIGLVAPTWVVAVAGAAAGPLLLGDRQWVLGAILTVIGWPVALLAGRALHNLTRRFVVFVPNGFVVHHLDVLREPVLFQKREIAGIGPALADTAAGDMTNAALGLALELKFGSGIELPVVTGRDSTEQQTLRAILISPSRPASLLAHARFKGLPIA